MPEHERPDLDQVREELERGRQRERSTPPTGEEIPPERVREAIERVDSEEAGEEE